MSITLTDPYLTLAREQAAFAGYADVTTYLEYLIERADVQMTARESTLAAVRDGLNDVATGRTRPIRTALADLAEKYGLAETQDEN